VHERLYRSENLSEVALSDYLRFLIDNLFRFYGANPQNVRLAFDAGDVKADINKAIPIGLIINELISNSLKYAFPDGRKGEISVAIHRQDHSLTILFKDNGVGMHEDVDWRNAKSMGLQLVIALVGQLDGTIELDRTAGMAFTIVVKEKV
jgi:two-component sensor histidine kinase